MSFFTDASLVMVPSGIKTSKVYSIKPTDGSGDLTFTRASNASRVNADGLVERVRTNLLLQSNTFNTTWAASNVTLTSGQSDKDGGNNAWQLSFNGTAGARIEQQMTVTTGVSYCFSVWMRVSSGTADVQIGAVGTLVQKTLTTTWQRFDVYGPAGGTTVFPQIRSVGTTPYSILIYQSQFEVSDFGPTDYIPTTTAAVSVGPVSGLPRLDYSGGATCPSLLLEPQRTNLVTYSEQFTNSSWINVSSGGTATITANYGISPSGYQDADRLQLSYSGGVSQYAQIYKSLTPTNGVSYTVSVYLKSLSGTPTILLGYYNGSENNTATLTTEWKRHTFTFVSDGSAIFPKLALGFALSSTSADFLAWGYQIEAGAYATSYIPTITAVTRLADGAIKTGVSSLIGQTEGTLFAVISSQQEGAAYNWLNLHDGSTNNWVFIGKDGNRWRNYVKANGTIIFDNSTTTIINDANTKIALAYKSGEIALYINGTQIATSSSTFTFSAVLSQITIGTIGAVVGDSALYSQALVFPTRLTNAQLAELTTL